MIRRIIEINQALCNGCGLCAKACHEGAIAMVDGKARLMRDDYCDGLGDCLPACPTGAISFVEREAAAYDEAAVLQRKRVGAQSDGCPGSRARVLARPREAASIPKNSGASRLRQWPVQLKLAPVNAPYLNGADLLLAADCAAYACGSFHEDFMRGRITLIGCPKLDGVDYSEKLTEIIARNEIRSLTVVRMEVPCCGGVERAALEAIRRSGKTVPSQVAILSTDGRILN